MPGWDLSPTNYREPNHYIELNLNINNIKNFSLGWQRNWLCHPLRTTLCISMSSSFTVNWSEFSLKSSFSDDFRGNRSYFMSLNIRSKLWQRPLSTFSFWVILPQTFVIGVFGTLNLMKWIYIWNLWWRFL